MSAFDEQIGGDHYKKLAIQPAEYNQRNKLNFLESSIIKCATRHRNKGGSEDIMKIIHWAQMLLELEYRIPSTIQYNNSLPDAPLVVIREETT